MSRNYKFYNPEDVHFVSFVVGNWLDVFIKPRDTIALERVNPQHLQGS